MNRLDEARNIWFVTVRASGRPHMVPVWFVSSAEKIYACIEPGSVKARNLRTNSNVCVALEDGNHPIICEGEACEVSRPWPDQVVELFERKYGWNIAAERQYTMLVEVTARKWLRW